MEEQDAKQIIAALDTLIVLGLIIVAHTALTASTHGPTADDIADEGVKLAERTVEKYHQDWPKA